MKTRFFFAVFFWTLTAARIARADTTTYLGGQGTCVCPQTENANLKLTAGRITFRPGCSCNEPPAAAPQPTPPYPTPTPPTPTAPALPKIECSGRDCTTVVPQELKFQLPEMTVQVGCKGNACPPPPTPSAEPTKVSVSGCGDLGGNGLLGLLGTLAALTTILGIVCLCRSCRRGRRNTPVAPVVPPPPSREDEERRERERAAMEEARKEAREQREREGKEEKARKRRALEDGVIWAQVAFDRDPNTATADRLLAMQVELARFDELFTMNTTPVTVQVKPGVGFVSGAPFLGGSTPQRPQPPPAVPPPKPNGKEPRGEDKPTSPQPTAPKKEPKPSAPPPPPPPPLPDRDWGKRLKGLSEPEQEPERMMSRGQRGLILRFLDELKETDPEARAIRDIGADPTAEEASGYIDRLKDEVEKKRMADEAARKVVQAPKPSNGDKPKDDNGPKPPPPPPPPQPQPAEPQATTPAQPEPETGKKEEPPKTTT